MQCRNQVLGNPSKDGNILDNINIHLQRYYSAPYQPETGASGRMWQFCSGVEKNTGLGGSEVSTLKIGPEHFLPRADRAALRRCPSGISNSSQRMSFTVEYLERAREERSRTFLDGGQQLAGVRFGGKRGRKCDRNAKRAR